MFSTFLLGHYQPLSWITLGADYLVWGMNPLGYHLTNLTIHAVGVGLFFEVLRTLFRLTPSLAEIGESWRDKGAFVGALLFGIHPLRVESVAWITERRDVLCGVFFLLSVLMYLRMHEKSSRGLSSGKAYGLSVLFFGLSLFSKALGIALPAVLLILDLWPLRRFVPGRRWTCFLQKVPYLLVALLDGIVMIFAMKNTLFKRVTQTISYLPHFVSWVVIAGIVYKLLDANSGIVNILIKSLGWAWPPFIRSRSRRDRHGSPTGRRWQRPWE